MCARHTIVETSAQPPAQTQAKQTPDMPPLRCAHASGPPEANALRATYRVAELSCYLLVIGRTVRYGRPRLRLRLLYGTLYEKLDV